jgi:hypothetical protein
MKLIFIILTLIATHANASPVLPCLGQSLDLYSRVNGPYVSLNYAYPSDAPKNGNFIIDTGTVTTTMGYSTVPLNVGLPNPRINFFGYMTLNHTYFSDFSDLTLPFTQTGMIGTDLLNQNVYTIDMGKREVFRSSFQDACSPGILKRSGFVPFSTHGFYTHDLQTLNSMTAFRPFDSDSNSMLVPNIPTIQSRIARVKAITQIDTGLADTEYPFSFNINRAFFDALNTPTETHLVQAMDIEPISLTTCVSGFSETLTAYRLKPGESFELVSSQGQVARTYRNVILFLKESDRRARSCGGIGTIDVPAVQIGMSFIKDMGSIILNAQTETIWIPHD